MEEISEIDDSALQRIRMLGGDQLLRRMIDAFLTDAEPRVRMALAGARDGNLEDVKRATHSLKSTAANLGALQLQRIARELEAASESDGADLIELAEELQSRFARATFELEAMRSAMEE
jgi:HPt (histidine-containing phosphotransfer) domain-containing protein